MNTGEKLRSLKQTLLFVLGTTNHFCTVNIPSPSSLGCPSTFQAHSNKPSPTIRLKQHIKLDVSVCPQILVSNTYSLFRIQSSGNLKNHLKNCFTDKYFYIRDRVGFAGMESLKFLPISKVYFFLVRKSLYAGVVVHRYLLS